jgi:putative (di)nucleoside polyphosphate hydrolase
MRDKRLSPEQLSLEEMLADPIVWTIMKSDGVSERDLRDLLKRVAAALAAGGEQTQSNAPMADHSEDYRRGVGIMLLNDRNEVFVGQRSDIQGDAWQMPQGGIDGNEEPADAAFRELREEIGTDKAKIIAESKSWLRYDLPAELRKHWNDRWRGQQQKWFVMRFEGKVGDINIATSHAEFSAWKWVPSEFLPDLIVDFKRQLYLDLLQELRECGTLQRSGR